MMENARKRSSLKHENIFPEGMTYEEWIALNKSRSIKWDQKVIIEEDPNPIELDVDLEEDHKIKEAETHYQDIVI